ncbi:protein kinase [Planomonospora corallina]|uniref:non-specific serine/threonine protein kinase n=1 Tax=Planomonospora corallina TaxID=1806052 RepID=A0ABV8I6U5_9ACTN
MSDSQELIAHRYRLLEPVGRGGMGTVWRARDEVLGRDVAVKEVVPSPDLTASEREAFTARTLREARAAGRIGHPCVATVYDVVEERNRPWIVMQFVESRTLGAVTREDGPLPPARVARAGLEVLGALLAADRVGVLHRDVKPDNVLIAPDGRAVLTDFGIAMLEGDSSVTRTGALIGTPAFIAPERAGGGAASLASDLWSLGVTLYMAVEGRSPFQRAHPLATLAAVMHEPPPPLRRAGALGPVICGLLRKDPKARMSPQEAQLRLRAVMDGTAPESTMPIDLGGRRAGQRAGRRAAVPPPYPFREGPVPAASAAAAALPAAGAVPPDAGTGTPPGRSPAAARQAPPRRRPVMTLVSAAALAVALSSGGMAWVTSRTQAGPAGPTGSPAPSVSATAPADGSETPPGAETVRTGTRDAGDGRSRTRDADAGGGRSGTGSTRGDGSSRDGSPSGSAGRPARGAPEKASGKPSGGPARKPSAEPSRPSAGNGRGAEETPRDRSGQDRGAGGGQGRDTGGEDAPGRVDPDEGGGRGNAPGAAVSPRGAGKGEERSGASAGGRDARG